MWRRVVETAIVVSVVLSGYKGVCAERTTESNVETESNVKKVNVTEKSKDEKPKLPKVSVKIDKRWRFKMPADIALGVGYMSGDGIQIDAGPMMRVSLGALPHFAYKKRKVKIGLDMRCDDRETFGFHLQERHVRGGPFAKMRFNKKYALQITGESGYKFRPDWPDAYQPVLDETGERTFALYATDRFSYFQADGGLDFKVRFHKQFFANLYSEYMYRNYVEDPHYDGTDDPNHLAPGDRDRWRGGLQIAGYVGKRIWRYTLDTRVDYIRYFRTYARDEKTGLTHASPGGEPANPLQRYVQVRIRNRNSFRLYKRVVRATAAVDYTRNKDLFEDYYTWNQVSGDVGLAISVSAWRVESLYSPSYRKYTDRGYQEANNHPPLDNGDTIRKRVSHGVKGEVAYSLRFDGLELFLEGGWSRDNTNFPDYEPGVFPANAAYRINWDTVNYFAVGGARVAL